jgi:hypothetical protein
MAESAVASVNAVIDWQIVTEATVAESGVPETYNAYPTTTKTFSVNGTVNHYVYLETIEVFGYNTVNMLDVIGDMVISNNGLVEGALVNGD